MCQDNFEKLISSLVARQAGLDPASIEPNKPFADYGLDSLAAVTLSGDLEIALGRRLQATLAWDYPSVAELARYLASMEDTV
jgi:acyl carrier protein